MQLWEVDIPSFIIPSWMLCLSDVSCLGYPMYFLLLLVTFFLRMLHGGSIVLLPRGPITLTWSSGGGLI